MLCASYFDALMYCKLFLPGFCPAFHADPIFLVCFRFRQLLGIGVVPSLFALGTLWIRAQLAN